MKSHKPFTTNQCWQFWTFSSEFHQEEEWESRKDDVYPEEDNTYTLTGEEPVIPALPDNEVYNPSRHIDEVDRCVTS